ncbi:hypothetical protein [Burkholderia ambifaria]|uniref:hypothetical protein n=1 Tax=Burkholderia ambifaria TaxID=152480 RepID=UPI001FC8B8C2|nr:hypothetical protein [Burkholderia ambifaria]
MPSGLRPSNASINALSRVFEYAVSPSNVWWLKLNERVAGWTADEAEVGTRG